MSFQNRNNMHDTRGNYPATSLSYSHEQPRMFQNPNYSNQQGETPNPAWNEQANQWKQPQQFQPYYGHQSQAPATGSPQSKPRMDGLIFTNEQHARHPSEEGQPWQQQQANQPFQSSLPNVAVVSPTVEYGTHQLVWQESIQTVNKQPFPANAVDGRQPYMGSNNQQQHAANFSPNTSQMSNTVPQQVAVERGANYAAYGAAAFSGDTNSINRVAQAPYDDRSVGRNPNRQPQQNNIQTEYQYQASSATPTLNYNQPMTATSGGTITPGGPVFNAPMSPSPWEKNTCQPAPSEGYQQSGQQMSTNLAQQSASSGYQEDVYQQQPQEMHQGYQDGGQVAPQSGNSPYNEQRRSSVGHDPRSSSVQSNVQSGFWQSRQTAGPHGQDYPDGQQLPRSAQSTSNVPASYQSYARAMNASSLVTTPGMMSAPPARENMDQGNRAGRTPQSDYQQPATMMMGSYSYQNQNAYPMPGSHMTNQGPSSPMSMRPHIPGATQPRANIPESMQANQNFTRRQFSGCDAAAPQGPVYRQDSTNYSAPDGHRGASQNAFPPRPVDKMSGSESAQSSWHNQHHGDTHGMMHDGMQQGRPVAPYVRQSSFSDGQVNPLSYPHPNAGGMSRSHSHPHQQPSHPSLANAFREMDINRQGNHPQQSRMQYQQPIVFLSGTNSFPGTIPLQNSSPSNNQMQSPSRPAPDVVSLLAILRKKPGTSYKKMRIVAEELVVLEEDVVKFRGRPGDKEAVYLEERLTQKLIALDDVAVVDDESRHFRRRLVVSIQQLLSCFER